ncbi:putative lipoprotein [Xanthomonas citri pv. punicae str. LMG 859]|nr:putative lipoprotein [Xanthomonas citri pv. punicae str. LMG 859]
MASWIGCARGITSLQASGCFEQQATSHQATDRRYRKPESVRAKVSSEDQPSI